jgi:prephenate dehydratase
VKVAIQGVKASFHEVATRKYFTEAKVEIIECSTFPKLFSALADHSADRAVMAIENSIAGSILSNYALMEKFKFKIMGEIYLRIELCLLCLPGEKLEDIQIIQSHPMALLQAQDFLMTLPNVKAMEHSDTAESAKDIKRLNLTHHASIASSLAAETYGLTILKKNVENNCANFTRFLVLVPENIYQRDSAANKASLRFETNNEPGSLAKIIRIFEEHSVNMTKIQSLPVIGRPQNYSFHVDLDWVDINNYERALSEIRVKAANLIIYGEYKAAERPQS